MERALGNSFAVTATLIGGLVLTAASPAVAADKRCTLGKVAEFQVNMQGMRPTVEIKLNGKPARLAVDSGSFFSILAGDAIDQFDLKRAPMPPNMIVRGTGGAAQFQAGNARTFELGTWTLTNYDFLVGGPRFGSEIDGLLGRNILGATDVEFDLGNGVVRMFRPQNCSGANFAYWAADKAVGTVALQQLDKTTSPFLGKVKVNGRDIRVLFDTGANTSVLRRDAAERLGFSPTGEGVVGGGLSGGIGRKMAESWVAPFASFEIGAENIKNTRLRVAEINLTEADMLLGADFFLSHRIYISRDQRKAYITYNGGPVFRLERLPADGPRPIAGADTAIGQGDLGSADEYTRRGKASAARRDYAAAIADFSKAIDMQPDEASHYYDRAAAHAAARQPVLALADLDQTLKLKPDQLDALLMRGELFLQRNQVPRAKADFVSAAALAGPQNTARLRIAEDYIRAGLSQEAIDQFNEWIAGHPSDRNNSEVLNERCWARALGNRELDLALADCNAAIKVSDNSIYLDRRGMAYFRLGQYDKAIADYDAAIKKQPNSAWSYYGRGLAKLKKGMDAEGRADIRQGLSINAGILQVAGRYGLAPPGAGPAVPARR
jgi:tetratricopeptide (TPR) repeat protein